MSLVLEHDVIVFTLHSLRVARSLCSSPEKRKTLSPKAVAIEDQGRFTSTISVGPFLIGGRHGEGFISHLTGRLVMDICLVHQASNYQIIEIALPVFHFKVPMISENWTEMLAVTFERMVVAWAIVDR